jgi:hypothetical protein
MADRCVRDTLVLLHVALGRARFCSMKSLLIVRSGSTIGSRNSPISSRWPSMASRGRTIIDLNPVAAKIAKSPETNDYTSIKQRVDHVATGCQTAQLDVARGGSVADLLLGAVSK